MIEQALKKALLPYTSISTWYVALSGGIDSIVLLYALKHAYPQVIIKAVHVNHGLSPNANQWEQHCLNVCQSLSVTLQVYKVNIKDAGKGIEAAARDARLSLFEKILDHKTVILTGHHRADQVETFLQRLCRGTGLKGLQSIPVARKLNRGQLLRPMLDVSKLAIEDYALQYQLRYVSDESNTDERFARNFLRHTIINQLKIKWPDCEQRIAQTITHIDAAQTLLETYLAEDLKQCQPQKIRFGHSICAQTLLDFTYNKQVHIVRYWLQTLNYPMPSSAQLNEVFKLLHAKEDACPIVNLQYYTLRRYQQRLVCLKMLPAPSQATLIWHPARPLILPDGTCLTLTDHAKPFFSQPPLNRLTVTFRQGKERCKPLGRGHSQLLKKLFQQYAIAPWLRNRIPLIYANEQILAVGDSWLCEHPDMPSALLRDQHDMCANKIVNWQD